MTAAAPDVLFRCEASHGIGGGHAMRCLALADVLAERGWTPCFATDPRSVDIVPGLARHARLAPDEFGALAGAAPDGFALAVIDGYGFDRATETSLREVARRIVAIDDLANRPHDCDVLIDQTVGRETAEYRNLVPADCRLLLGCEHALLRPEFARARPASLARRNAGGVARILLSFGASDPKGLGLAVAIALLARQDAPALDLAIDDAGLAAARDLARANPDRIAIHHRTGDMARLMADADLAAGAAGGTSWERCALGLPTVAIAVADNQRLIAARLAAAGAIDLVPEDAAPAEIAARLMALAGDAKRRAEMARAAAAFVDARGLERVYLRLCPPQRTPNGTMVALRAIERADLPTIFEWQNQEGQRRYSRDTRAPTWERHGLWFETRLQDPGWLLAIVEADGVPRGLLQFHLLANGAREVSILIDLRAHGRGIGAAALRAARAAMPGVVLVAEIAPENAASLAIFAKAGYRPDGARYVSMPADGISRRPRRIER